MDFRTLILKVKSDCFSSSLTSIIEHLMFTQMGFQTRPKVESLFVSLQETSCKSKKENMGFRFGHTSMTLKKFLNVTKP